MIEFLNANAAVLAGLGIYLATALFIWTRKDGSVRGGEYA
jgi:hypothetical protein